LLGLTDSWQQQLQTVAALNMIQFVIPVTKFSPNWTNMFLKTNLLNVLNFEYLEVTLKSKD
jgi:hypothetical protein